ncbi:hypothetical protein AYI69_g2198 [Smittium culicis]|uniref:Uncharacterized protein n=1 Tax=Smittium culicis TaxID=133412 RepID=A0A1R1YN36_9FUNG|nr:hypothetical protein AYI69_g2198 [Smittium culicis]
MSFKNKEHIGKRKVLQGHQSFESKSHLKTGGKGPAIGVRKGFVLLFFEILHKPTCMVASESGLYANSE